MNQKYHWHLMFLKIPMYQKSLVSPKNRKYQRTQKYQKFEGAAQLGNLKAGLREARLRGDQIWFTLVDVQGVKREFAGKVSGARIEGTARLDNGSEVRFTATKG